MTNSTAAATGNKQVSLSRKKNTTNVAANKEKKREKEKRKEERQKPKTKMCSCGTKFLVAVKNGGR